MSDAFFDAVADVDREPLAMGLARRIREAIVNGDLRSGTPLPSEKDLSARFGVGRTTVREALRVLQAQGLVTGGDRVTTKGPTITGDGLLPSASFALENMMLLGQVSLPELVSLRLLVETSSMRAAAARNDVAALGRARTALNDMRGAGTDVDRFQKADVAFHTALVDAAGNRAFVLVMNVLRDTMSRHLRDALNDEEAISPVVEHLLVEHEAILSALQHGDGDTAARILGEHLHAFYDRHCAR
jgi:GntR family transcriptional repressor for pyruvate dehydrogenase complex